MYNYFYKDINEYRIFNNITASTSTMLNIYDRINEILKPYIY